MQKKRAQIKRRQNTPALVGLLLCAALYVLQLAAYFDAAVARHVLLSIGFPAMYAAPYSAYRAPSAPPVMPEAGAEPDISIELSQSAPPAPTLSGEEPTVLIYHTHATEAYFKTNGYTYKNNGDWRTLEANKSILAVGERLSSLLHNRYGISVIHDCTNHEPPKLATAYSRSVKTMEKYRGEYKSLVMYIDVHRDSYGNDPKEVADFVSIDGKEYARIMFVVGTGKGATGTGYGEMPDFDANYALAKRITDILAGYDKRLVREIRVKTGRYNQHISDQCLLVEVGHNANTLEQALNSMDFLAAAIAEASGIKAGRQLSLTP